METCLQQVQLNEYETAPNFIQLSQNLTRDCLLISVFLPVFTSFAWCDHKIVLFWSAEQYYDHITQKWVKTQKSTNNQCQFLAWLKKIWNCVIFISCKISKTFHFFLAFNNSDNCFTKQCSTRTLLHFHKSWLQK